MLCCIMHWGPTLDIIWEEKIGIYTVIKKIWHFIFIILANQFLQLVVISKLYNMLLLFVLHYNVTTDTTLGRVTVACDSMCSDIRWLNYLLAIWAQHGLLYFLIIVTEYFRIFQLLLPFCIILFSTFWLSSLLRCTSNSPTLWFSSFIKKIQHKKFTLTDLAENMCSLWTFTDHWTLRL